MENKPLEKALPNHEDANNINKNNENHFSFSASQDNEEESKETIQINEDFCCVHPHKKPKYVDTSTTPGSWKMYCSECAVGLAQTGQKLTKISKSKSINDVYTQFRLANEAKNLFESSSELKNLFEKSVSILQSHYSSQIEKVNFDYIQIEKILIDKRNDIIAFLNKNLYQLISEIENKKEDLQNLIHESNDFLMSLDRNESGKGGDIESLQKKFITLKNNFNDLCTSKVTCVRMCEDKSTIKSLREIMIQFITLREEHFSLIDISEEKLISDEFDFFTKIVTPEHTPQQKENIIYGLKDQMRLNNLPIDLEKNTPVNSFHPIYHTSNSEDQKGKISSFSKKLFSENEIPSSPVDDQIFVPTHSNNSKVRFTDALANDKNICRIEQLSPADKKNKKQTEFLKSAIKTRNQKKDSNLSSNQNLNKTSLTQRRTNSPIPIQKQHTGTQLIPSSQQTGNVMNFAPHQNAQQTKNVISPQTCMNPTNAYVELLSPKTIQLEKTKKKIKENGLQNQLTIDTNKQKKPTSNSLPNRETNFARQVSTEKQKKNQKNNYSISPLLPGNKSGNSNNSTPILQAGPHNIPSTSIINVANTLNINQNTSIGNNHPLTNYNSSSHNNSANNSNSHNSVAQSMKGEDKTNKRSLSTKITSNLKNGPASSSSQSGKKQLVEKKISSDKPLNILSDLNQIKSKLKHQSLLTNN